MYGELIQDIVFAAMDALSCDVEIFGIAIVLSPIASASSVAKISVSLTTDTAHTMDDTNLELLRTRIPAARSLPLLCALAQQQHGRIVLDYFDHLRLAVDTAPC